MPNSIASQIARRLDTDAYETASVIEELTQDIRRQVAQEGKAAVPGLGIFRSFGGRIVFEPEQALAMEINQRYAGLEPLLVNPPEHLSGPQAANGDAAQERTPADENYPAEVPSLAIHPPDDTGPETEEEDRIETAALGAPSFEETVPAGPIDVEEEDAGMAGAPPEMTVDEAPELEDETFDPEFAAAAASASGDAFLSREPEALDEEDLDEDQWDDMTGEPEPAPPEASSTQFFEPWPFETEGAGKEPEPVAEEPEIEPYGLVEPENKWEAETAQDRDVIGEEYAEEDAGEMDEETREAVAYFREEEEKPEEPTFRPAPIDEEPSYAGSYVIPSPPPTGADAPPAVTERRRSRAPLILAAVVVLAIIGIAAYVLTRPAQQQTQPPTDITEADPLPAAPTDTAAVITPTDSAAAVAEEPEPPEPEPPTPLRPAGGIDVSRGGLTLVVASVPERDVAMRTAERFRNAGYTPIVFYGEYGGFRRYRVGIGQFLDESEAEAQRNNLPDIFPDDAWLMPIQSDMVVVE